MKKIIIQTTWEKMMTTLKAIEDTPKCSIYSLAKILKWSPGKTENYVKRLLNHCFIYKTTIQRNGRTCSELVAFPKEHYEVAEKHAD